MRGVTGAAILSLAMMGAAFAKDGDALFDGKSLKGWKQLGGAADYQVQDGAIVGTTKPNTPNSFLVTEKQYGDFVLEFDVRQDVGPTNSGVQFRSHSTAEFENGRVHGYQADIDPSPRQWSGQIYEEAKRGWFTTGETNPPSKQLYKFGEWNHYRIEAIGPRMRVWINNGAVADLIDDASKTGFIALQVHSINKEEEAGRTVSWKNITVQTKGIKPKPSMGIYIRNNLPNDLHADEKAQGWRLLWDGKTGKGWRSTQAEGFPAKGWSMTNGELAVQSKGGGGDIMTDEEFGAFELQLEFKVSAGANSGIFYYLTSPLIDPTSRAPNALEYQILDDERHPDAKMGIDGNRTVASLYDLYPRAKLMTNVGIGPKIDVWQHARIVSRADGSVEHWLNGVKVLEFQRGSNDYRAKVATSKFKD